jgi:hypothetical protein
VESCWRRRCVRPTESYRGRVAPRYGRPAWACLRDGASARSVADVATLRTALLALALAAFALPAQETPSAVRVRGIVVDSVGLPIAGAEVRAVGTALLVITGDSGIFRFELPPGPVVFAVRRLGYVPATFLATLTPSARIKGVTLALQGAVHSLPGVLIAEQREQAWLRVFNDRKDTQQGTFITRSDIEKSRARLTTDILRRRVPGAQVVMTRYGTRVYMRGNSSRRCAPQLFVHATPYSGEVDDFSPDVVEAIEVYSGPSETPPELNIGRSMCGAIVIWTRDPRRAAGRE